MSQAKQVMCILKIGPAAYMEEFWKKGRLYMNTLRYFKSLEAKDKLRADQSEGLHSSFPADRARVAVGGQELRNLIGQIRVGGLMDNRIAIYSMYAITELTPPHSIDDRVLGFGDTAVIILKGDEFIERVIAECERRSWGYQTDLVTYVDPTKHSGDMGPFRKYSGLEYQSEFRLAVISGNEGPVTDFYIGDISDISLHGPSDKLKGLFQAQG